MIDAHIHVVPPRLPGVGVLNPVLEQPADQVAAAADLVAGQADERRPLVLVRGLQFDPSNEPAAALCRTAREDLYA